MRKRFQLMIVAVVAVAAIRADANTAVVDGIEWTYVLNAGEATIFNPSYNAAIPTATAGAITIPSTLDGYPVTSIGAYAFVACSGLTSVTIPAGVTSVGTGAFVACGGIRCVTVPQSVCSSSLSAVFPSSYQSITNVVISDGVTRVGDYAFQNCTSLVNVTIPDSVSSIGEDAFDGCNNALFDTATIPGVKLVHGWVVGHGNSLSGGLNLTGIRGIGDYAFVECQGLTGVTVPDGVVSIGYAAFFECDALTHVTIPNSVTNIGGFAFNGCTGLVSVTISSGVTYIGEGAFGYCNSLTNVIFKGNAPSADNTSFQEVGPGCIANVSRASTGWGEGEKWHGLTLVYVDGGGDGDELVCEIVHVAVEDDVQGGVSVRRMIVGVVAKDGGQIVQGDPEKVAAMFEATSDLRDWYGASKLTPTVEVLQGVGTTMRFRVTPGDGTATCAFLRIRR